MFNVKVNVKPVVKFALKKIFQTDNQNALIFNDIQFKLWTLKKIQLSDSGINYFDLKMLKLLLLLLSSILSPKTDHMFCNYIC